MITELDKLTLDDCAFINADCMEGLKRLPDKCIDLAVVDPPYGSGGANGATESASDNVSTSTANRGGNQYTYRERTSSNQTGRGVIRTGGGWSNKYDPTKKLLRGTQRRGKNTLQNFSVSHEIR